MTTEPITYISLHLGPKAGANDAVVGVRVVPDSKVGDVIYARTLNPGEPDTDEGISLNVGEKLVFPPGSVKITLEDVDRYARPESDGYADVTNTVWTWLRVPPPPDETFFNYLLTLSRRLDMSHALCASALREVGERPDEPFIRTRERIFNALGHVESMCVAFAHAIEMMKDAHVKLTVASTVPKEVEAVQEATFSIRNAFIHFDERAMTVAHGMRTEDGRSIYSQPDLVKHGTLHFAGHSLDLQTQVIPALVAARRYVYDVISEAGTTKTFNQPIEFGPFADDGEIVP